jgi:hypothetical protein
VREGGFDWATVIQGAGSGWGFVGSRAISAGFWCDFASSAVSSRVWGRGRSGGEFKEDERHEKIIRGLPKLPANKRCINCNNLVSLSSRVLFIVTVIKVNMCGYCFSV